MDSRYKIPALPKYLKTIRDAGEEGNPGRGKTGAERDSEKNQVTKSQESHWREKVYECNRAPVPQTDTGR